MRRNTAQFCSSACMCMYQCVCMYINVSAYTRVCINVHVYASAPSRASTCLHVFQCACTCISVLTRISVFPHVLQRVSRQKFISSALFPRSVQQDQQHWIRRFSADTNANNTARKHRTLHFNVCNCALLGYYNKLYCMTFRISILFQLASLSSLC